MDVAIMMLIVGLLAVPFMQKLHADDLKRKRDVTRANFDAINAAIADYYFQWGYYPCPADLTRSPADPDYGQEVRVPGTPPGACGGAGIAALDGRDVDYDGPAGALHPDGTPERLLVGGVPFATLRLPVSAALDAWSGKFSYVVSEALTAGVINFDRGAITMWGFNEVSPDVFVEGQMTDRAHYALVSHGENGVGGYSADGVLMQPCPAAGTSAPKEQKNCSFTDRIYFGAMESSLLRGPDYNDDITYSQDAVPTRIWIEATNDDDIVSGVQNIGIGTRTPIQDPAVQLDVVGNVRASASALATSLCSPAAPPSPAVNQPANCHSPQAIGGAGIGCWADNPNQVPPPAAGVMTGIAGVTESQNLYNFYDGARCRQVFTAGVIGASTCPPGQAVTGIDASGGIVCGAI